MRIRFLLAAGFLLPLFSGLIARGEPVLKAGDRVAICGVGQEESIYIEDYLVDTSSVPGLDISQMGWVGGDPAQIEKDVLPFHPTVVIGVFSGDAAAVTKAIDALKKAGVRTIVIGPPGYIQGSKRGPEAEMLKEVAGKEGATYADVYGATQAMPQMLPNQDIYSLAVTGAFLRALGCDGDIGSVKIDFATGTAQASAGQEAGAVRDQSVKVTSPRIPFWYPGHGVGGGDRQPWPDLKYVSFEQELNRYMLYVTGLPAGETKIYWGDDNRDFSSEELARGVNLEAEIPGWGNPFAGTAGSVDNAVRGQQQTESIAAGAEMRGNPDPQAAGKREAAFQLAESRLAPVHSTIRIQPLAAVEPQPAGPIPVIIDTDLDGDVDDVGAVALLNDFMDQGEATLLACVHDTENAQQSSCAAIQAIDAYYGHSTVPIGQYYPEDKRPADMKSTLLPAPEGEGAYHKSMGLCGSSYTLALHQRFDPQFPNDDKMPAGVDVYRKALAAAPDGKVAIVSVGLMQNIQDLLQSQPDSVSPLSGMELVKKKVWELVIMANTVPQDHYLLSKWPTKIIWTTYVGSGIGTGPSLIPTPANNPVRMAYDLFGVLHTGRQSWDLTASWLAIRGPGDVWDLVAGRPQYINDITHTPTAPHSGECEATVKMPYPEVSKLIGEELARAPKY